MLMLVYSEVNILCILVLLMIGHKMANGFDRRQTKRQFLRVAYSNVLFFSLDLVWIWVDGSAAPASSLLNYLLNATYYVVCAVTAYFWFIFSETTQQSSLVSTKKRRVLCFLPVVIIIVLAAFSYNKNLLFYIDENNVYHRGALYPVQLLLSYGYIAFTAIKAFVLSFSEYNYLNREKFRTLASFVVWPIVFGMLQTLIPSTPLLCVGITLALLNVYFNSLSQQISIDPLTQMNNRNQLMRYLSERLAHPDRNDNLWVLVADVDYFKKINDRYGHIEGDAALLRVANAITTVCGHTNGFASRFGGDEFVIVCDFISEQSLPIFVSDIQAALSEANAQQHAPYKLGISIGYARYKRSIKTCEQFIAMADSELYRVKRSRPARVELSA